MSASLIVQLLAQRPPEELARLREQMRSDISRLTVEVAQVEEAQARQVRRSPRPAGTKQLGGTKKRILDVVAGSGQPLLAAEVHKALQREGSYASRGTVHTTLGRLVDGGELERIGTAGSLRYQHPSRNGASAAASSGPTEIGTGGPLSTAPKSHEGAQEVLGS